MVETDTEAMAAYRRPEAIVGAPNGWIKHVMGSTSSACAARPLCRLAHNHPVVVR
jgi:hypothetical protein